MSDNKELNNIKLRTFIIFFLCLLVFFNTKVYSNIFNYISLDTSNTIAGLKIKEGMREDIYNYIEDLKITEEQKKYLMIYARGVQKQVTFFEGSIKNPEQFSQHMILITVCFLSSFENLEVGIKYSKNIESYTANTKKRKKGLYGYSKSRDGTVTRLPSTDKCNTLKE